MLLYFPCLYQEERRYIGLAKTRLQCVLTTTAINIERIYAWLEKNPLAKTHVSHFEKIANQKLAII